MVHLHSDLWTEIKEQRIPFVPMTLCITGLIDQRASPSYSGWSAFPSEAVWSPVSTHKDRTGTLVGMTSQPADVWYSRDLPVLTFLAKHFDAGGLMIEDAAVAAATGMDPTEVSKAIHALQRRRFIDAAFTASGWAHVKEVSGDAYTLTGLHPAPGQDVTTLIDALNQAADQQADPEEKTKLRKTAEIVGSMSQSVVSGVITAVIRAQTGM